VKKFGFGGRAGISSKFYKCDHFKGKGIKSPQDRTMIKVFHCVWRAWKGTAVKLFRYPYPPSQLKAIFLQFQRDEEGLSFWITL
jgi:hypothetical protein